MFLPTKKHISKHAQCFDQSFCNPELFFVQLLVYELWAIFVCIQQWLTVRWTSRKTWKGLLRNMPSTLTSEVNVQVNSLVHFSRQTQAPVRVKKL